MAIKLISLFLVKLAKSQSQATTDTCHSHRKQINLQVKTFLVPVEAHNTSPVLNATL